jgi:hypothetical protein
VDTLKIISHGMPFPDGRTACEKYGFLRRGVEMIHNLEDPYLSFEPVRFRNLLVGSVKHAAVETEEKAVPFQE